MKFYLTKAAQRAAESGQPPVKKEKVAKAPSLKAEKAPKEPKAPRVKAEKAPSARQLRAAAAAAPTVATAPSASLASAPAPVSPVVAPVAVHAAAPVASSVAAPAAPTAATAVLDAPVAPVAEAPAAKVRGLKPSKDAAPAKEKKGVITIGGAPRVDLLPLEVRAERKAGQKVRRAWFGVAAVVVLVGLASGGATLFAQGATASLAAEQATTSRLTQEQVKYFPAKTTQGQVDLIDAAQLVGGSTDIDWPKYLENVALTVPAGATLSGVNVDAASPVVAFAQASTPLEGQRVATLVLTATSSSLPSVPTWLDNLTKLKGYEDATAGTIALSEGVYTSTVTLHVNTKAFSNAYTKGK